MTKELRAKRGSVWKFVVGILGCEAVGFLGSWFTFAEIPTWYASLNRPWFQPPNWLFGPVWTLLYALMGIAAARLWSVKRADDGLKRLFLGQLFLNFLWTPVFFGAHNLLGGLLIILAMDVCVAALIRRLWRADRTSAILLFPYLAWILFATLLNTAILHLNP